MRQQRLAAVARAYLGGPVRRDRLVVVAGDRGAPSLDAAHALQRAAAGLGLSSVLVQRGRETVDLEVASESGTSLVIYHHGEIDDAELRQLPPPGKEGADLLVWCPVPGRGPRWIYRLAMWVWSLHPRHVRCVVDTQTMGGFDLGALRYRLAKGLRRAETEGEAELLRLPDESANGAAAMLYQQILQSLLSSSRPRRRASRDGVRAKANVAVLLLLLGLCLANPTVGAQSADPPPTVVVDVWEFGPARDRVLVAEGGASLYRGPSYFLRLEAGVGAWSGDGSTLTLSSRAKSTEILLDGETPEWGSGVHRVEKELVLHCPEYTIVLRRGRVEMLADRVVVRPVLGGNPMVGRGSGLLALALAGIIFFLLWRANSMQKRLDRPRVSLRHRRPPPAESED